MTIAEIVQKIRTAIYGKDIRSSIADGIETINSVAEEAKTIANTATENADAAAITANNAAANANNAASAANTATGNANNAANAANLAKAAYDAATHENTVVELTDARHDNITNTDYANIGARMDVFSSHLSETVSYASYVDRDVSIAGAQQVRGIGFKPKALIVFYTVQGDTTNKKGFAVVTPNTQIRLTINISNLRWIEDAGKSILIDDGSENYTDGVITLVDDGFDIIWTITGTGGTGAVRIGYLALTH